MFYDSTAFNDARQRSEVSPDAVFIINDIELVVPPTNIIVHKEDMYWNWKTLRTNISTKISSGQGFCQATVNIIFTPDLILHLHRLIVQIKNSPFCFIENQFLRDSIVPGWDQTKFMAFCVSSFFVNNVPGLPGSFRVQLDLKWFNYEPYTANYLFKTDFLTYPIIEGNKHYQYTIPTIIGRDLETSHVPIDISPEEMLDYYSDYTTLSERNFQEIISERKKQEGPRTLLENFTGFIFDGMGLPNVIMPSAATLPFNSNIYKRYINDLQMRSLYDNFNIDFYKEIQKYFGVTFSDNGEVYGQLSESLIKDISNLLNCFTIGEKILRKNSMSYRKVFSLHSATDEVKKGSHEIIQNIIGLMHSRHSSFELHYKEFKKLAVPPFLERIKSKIRKEQYLEGLKLKQQSSRIVSRASASSIYNAYKDSGGGTKGFENSSENTIVINGGNSGEEQSVKISGHQEKAVSLSEFEGGKGMIHPPVGNLKDRALKPFVNSGFGWRTLKNENGEIIKDANHNGIDFTATRLGTPLTLEQIVNILNDDPNAISLPPESKEIIKRDLQEFLIISNNENIYDEFFTRRSVLNTYKDKLHPVFAVESGIVINSVDIEKARSTSGGGLEIYIQHNSSPDESSITSVYMHLSYALQKIQKGAKVEKGEIIGFVGNSGASFGDHLHFGIKSTVPGEYSNMWIPPYPLLVANFEEPELEQNNNEEEELKEGIEKAGMQLTGDKEFKTLTKVEKEVLATYIAMQEDYVKAGWKPYLKDLNTNNIWERTGTLSLSSVMGVLDSYEAELDHNPKSSKQSELEQLKESIYSAYSSLSRDASLTNLESLKKELYTVHSSLKITQNVVVTGVGAGFSNIIASIPILDYEFPTTQHLGQMEPSYNFEIQMITDLDNLNGLPAEGKVLNRLFQTMQENARSFRQVPDGSNFNLDTFITRLMGSYLHGDLDLGIETGQKDLLPRFVLNRSSIETVEGSPGRSLMNLEITQSNPFFTEKIEAVRSVSEKVEETAYKEVLRKLFHLQLTDHGKQAFLLSLLDKGNNHVYRLNNVNKLSHLDRGNLSNQELMTFGESNEGRLYAESTIQENIYVVNSTLQYQIDEGNLEKLNGFVFDQQEILNLLKDDPTERMFFNRVGISYEVNDSNPDDIKLKFEEGSLISIDGENTEGYVSEESLIDFYDKHPSYESLKEGTGEVTIEDLKKLYLELEKTLTSYRFCIAEPEVGGIPFDEIADTLYDINYWTLEQEKELCDEVHYPSLWRNFIYWTVWFLRSNIGDRQPDPLDGGLGWTSDQLENYLNSIEFQGLYKTQEERNSDESTAIANNNYKISIWINSIEYVIYSGGKYELQSIKIDIENAIMNGDIDFIADAINENIFLNIAVNSVEPNYQSIKDEVIENYLNEISQVQIIDDGDSSFLIDERSSNEIDLVAVDKLLDLVNFYYFAKQAQAKESLDIDEKGNSTGSFSGTFGSIGKEYIRNYLNDLPESYKIAIQKNDSYEEYGMVLQTLFLAIENEIITEVNMLNLKDLFAKGFSTNRQFSILDYAESKNTADDLLNLLKENPEVIKSLSSRIRSTKEIFRKAMINIFVDDFLDLLKEEEEFAFLGEKKEPNKVNFERIYYKDSEFIASKLFRAENFLENEIYDALYTNSMGGWIVAAGAYLGDGVTGGNSTDGEDIALMATGETLSQLVAKATLFMISRTMIYTKYLDSLYSESLSVGVYDQAIDTKFASLKPFAKLAFTKKKLLENGASGPMLSFSSLEVYFNKFIEWMLEPRLINNIGLDIKLGSAGGADNLVENIFIESLGTFVGMQNAGGLNGPLDMQEIENVARDGKGVFQNKLGLAGGAADATAIGYYGYKVVKGGALVVEGSAAATLALIGLVPTLLTRTAGNITGGDDILEVDRISGNFDADSLNKMLVTNMLINPKNSATYSYYNTQGNPERFGSTGTIKKQFSPEMLPGSQTISWAGSNGEMISSPFTYENVTSYKLDPFTTDDVRTNPDIKKFLNLNQYVDLEMERMKLEVIRGKLEAIVKTVLSSRDLCYALDIKYGEATAQSFSKPRSFGDSCYPDINIPKHPFYQESNIEMSPDFYMWNIYDDGGAKVTREYMDELEKQSKIMLYGAHYHQEKMMEGIQLDGNYNAEVLQGIGDLNANIGNSNSILKMSPEGTHLNKIPTDIEEVNNVKILKYESIGETTTPFFEVGGPVERNDEFIQKLITILRESEGKDTFTFAVGNNNKEYTTVEQVEAERARIYKYITLGSKKAQKKYIEKPGGYDLVQAVSEAPDVVGKIGTDVSTSIGESLLGIESLPSDKSELPTVGSSLLNKIPNVTISRIPKINTDDLNPLSFGLDGDLQKIQYNKMISAVTKIKDIENMFGNGAGYMGELITEEAVNQKEEMAELLKDIQVKSFGKQDSYTQAFQPEALSALAKASSVDFFSEKKKLGQAFPTFKLYFVEEDEFESRFLNLDDFYSFNGVKSFTVTRSRDNPGDTAVIALQNVAGTLDGTKRGSIVDLDYFSEKRIKRIEREAKQKGETITTAADNFDQNVQSDQPFDAVVLRPGMNVQLRCGYSNNPDLLEVLLSGRITDVSITGNDGMEIVVQSFGVELIAQTKRYINENEGLNELTEHDVEDQTNKFYTTHQLLGQMMLEPELKHFGRWERGRLFQYGEMQDSSLDFFRYKEAIKPSTFRNISNTFYYVMGSTLAIAAVVLAARAGNLSAVTRGLNTSGRLMNVAGSVFNPRFLGGIFTYARAGFSKSVSASTYAGRNIIRGRLGRYTNDAVAGLQGVDSGVVETARILMMNIDDVLKVFSVRGIGGIARVLKDPGRIFRGNLGMAKEYLTKGGRYTDDLVEALTNLKGTLQSTEYGTKAAGFIIKNIDDLLKGIAEGTLSTPQAISKLKSIATASENIALFTVSPASPMKSIVLNGFKSLSAVEVLGFATSELFVAGFASSAIAFKLSILYGGLGYYKDSLYENVYEYRDAMKKWMTKELAYFKMRPSDDNLFCPSPLHYMHMLKVEDPGFWATIKYSFVLGLTGVEGAKFDDLLDQWKNQNPLIHLKKVSMEESIYYLENKTIWDIFYEMTLRHPGYIYAAVPYGKEFRYTMFFGIPSQRYWSKGVSNGYVQRMNLLRENLVNPPDSIEAVIARSKLLYGDSYGENTLADNYQPTENGVHKTSTIYVLDQKGIDELLLLKVKKLKESLRSEFGTRYDSMLDTWVAYHSIGSEKINGKQKRLPEQTAQILFEELQKGVADRNEYDRIFSLQEELSLLYSEYTSGFLNESEKSLSEKEYFSLVGSERIKFHSRVMKEYLMGLENRFVPFRRYHQIRSDRDIVRNSISISAARPVNSVNVYYKDLTNSSEPKTKSIFMKASSSLSDSELNTANITNYITNVRSHSMALRYGMGSLIYGMKEMYSGEILVLGNPRIKPWDVCFLFDNYNDMAGPVEVKSVTHMFSFETGFLTEIVPNALVFGNETSSLPVMEALKVYLAASLNLETSSNKTPPEANMQVESLTPENQSELNNKVEEVIGQHNREIDKDNLKFESPKGLEDMKAGAFTQKIGLVQNPKFNGYNLSFDTAKYMEERYTGLAEEGIVINKDGKLGFDYSKVIPDEYLQGKDIFNNDEGIGSYLPTIESYAEKAVTGSLALHYATNPTDHIFKGSGGGAALDAGAITLTGAGLYSIFGKGKGGLGALAIGAAGLLYVGASYTNAVSFKSHLMDKFSASYLLGAPVIFSRLTQEEAVTVIPLVKEGRPLTTVTSNRDPLSIWKNVFGNFINIAQDSFLGAMDNYKETEALGNEFWKHLEKSNKEFGNDASFKKLKESGALYKMIKD